MQLDTLIKWGLFGAVLSVVLGYRSTLNWKKMYRVLGSVRNTASLQLSACVHYDWQFGTILWSIASGGI